MLLTKVFEQNNNEKTFVAPSKNIVPKMKMEHAVGEPFALLWHKMLDASKGQ